MGDKITKATIDKMVRLPLTLIGDSGEEYTATVDLQILPDQGKDIIIGMPSLIVDYGYLYLDLMTVVVETYGRTDTLTLRPDGYEE